MHARYVVYFVVNIRTCNKLLHIVQEASCSKLPRHRAYITFHFFRVGFRFLDYVFFFYSVKSIFPVYLSMKLPAVQTSLDFVFDSASRGSSSKRRI